MPALRFLSIGFQVGGYFDASFIDDNQQYDYVGRWGRQIVSENEEMHAEINAEIKANDDAIKQIMEDVESSFDENDQSVMELLDGTKIIEAGKCLKASYVPSEWGHDVCKLLNIRVDNDWRLLGKRFGYSTSELKH
ncbi:unnamed protein product [Rotaria sp. Silwood2]|nr:unnamed protein product [Rotaria sp. Silwood2]